MQLRRARGGTNRRPKLTLGSLLTVGYRGLCLVTGRVINSPDSRAAKTLPASLLGSQSARRRGAGVNRGRLSARCGPGCVYRSWKQLQLLLRLWSTSPRSRELAVKIKRQRQKNRFLEEPEMKFPTADFDLDTDGQSSRKLYGSRSEILIQRVKVKRTDPYIEMIWNDIDIQVIIRFILF